KLAPCSITASPSSASSRASSSLTSGSSVSAALAAASLSAGGAAASASGGAASSGIGRVGDPARGALVGAPPLAGVLVLDALLQQHDALDERLGARRAAGYVHVDRDDLVDAFRHRVRVPVGTPAVRARAHRDHVLGVGHLLVEALDRGRHL